MTSYNYAPRSFVCAQCGELITINNATDKRTRFCSALCERRYWRKSKNYPKNKVEVKDD